MYQIYRQLNLKTLNSHFLFQKRFENLENGKKCVQTILSGNSLALKTASEVKRGRLGRTTLNSKAGM